MARKRVEQNLFNDQYSSKVDCERPDCRQTALCRIKTDLGWQILCDYHYNEHFTLQARHACEDKGLVTTEQLRHAFRTGTATLMRRMRNREVLVQREPGEDWDEPITA